MIICIVSDGKRGHLAQTEGLADALLERAREAQPSGQHLKYVGDISRLGWWQRLLYKGRELEHPVPDLILCAGHGTHLAALALARHHKKALCMVCMKPSLPRGFFDLCLVPQHDLKPLADGVLHKPQGNLFPTIGAPSNVRPQPEVEKRHSLALSGGPSKDYAWDSEMLLNQLSNIARHSRGNIVLTNSRRTPADFLPEVQQNCPSIRIVPVEETAPGWVAEQLAAAKEVWVSQDSVSMVYEALSSGAPVGLLDMPRRDKSKKGSRVIRGMHMLRDADRVTTYTQWAQCHNLHQSQPLNEAGRAADYILKTFPLLLS